MILRTVRKERLGEAPLSSSAARFAKYGQGRWDADGMAGQLAGFV